MKTAEKTAAPFAWLGGDPALDFCNTRSWGDGQDREERLVSYTSLVRWSEQAGLVADGAGLLRAAQRDPDGAAEVLARALSLRGLLHELLGGRAEDAGDPARLDEFNRQLRDAAGSLAIGPGPSGAAVRPGSAATDRTGNRGYAWRWRDSGLARPLWPLVWAAAELLISGQPVSRCAGPDCGWLFIDRSRRGNRRWCDMKVCGSRDKARRYYRRRKRAAGP